MHFCKYTSKIGSVGGHHDEGEEPPHDGYCTGGDCSVIDKSVASVD